MNIIIAGCVKNCEKYLQNVFNNIKIISDNFYVVKIICSFDKSDDNTLLELCKQKNNFKNLEIIINKQPLSIHRTINISNARNRILNFIEKSELNADYLIMMDFDDVCSNKINIEVLKNAFIIKSQWDILTFMNQKYYDFWALSFNDYIFSCWHNNNPRYIIKCMNELLYKEINGKKLLECYSSFNGFGIYNINKIKGIRYESINYISFYNKNFLKNIKIVEDKTKTKYNLNNKVFLDCEHRLYQINCKLKNNSKNMIFNEYLFSKHESEHNDFL
jgi:hypothetical protein